MGPVLSKIHANKQARYNYKYVDTNGDVYIGTKEGRLTKFTTSVESIVSQAIANAAATTSTTTSGVTDVTATSPITSSGGTTPIISTSMNTNKLIGRSTAGTGVMEEITIGTNLTLSGGVLDAAGGTGGSGIPHSTASGTDTYTATITGVTSYADGDAYLIRFTNGNTTSATLNINSIGAIDLYRNNDGALIGGDIIAGSEMLLVYNSTLNVFQCIGTAPNTLLAYVTNADSVTINKGQPVYAFGGTGDRITVKLAYNTTDATSAQTIGVVQSTSIAAGQKGMIIMQGQLDNLSIFPTPTWADGDPIYLGSTAGTLTKTKPSAPNHLVYIGYVLSASPGSAGRMYVRPQNGYELKELHDVQANSPSNNDTIYYDSSVSQWKTKQLSTTDISGLSTYLTDRRGGNFYRKSQRWYVPSDNTNTLTATNHSTPSVFLVPFPVHTTMVIDQIAVEVTTAGAVGSFLRFGIYNGDTTTVVPTTLVVDSGDIAATPIGVKTFTPGTAITLTPGLYFTAFTTSSATVVGVRSLTTTNFAQVIGLTAAGGTSLGTYINGTRGAYGALPANASSLAALNPTIGNIYALFYRIQ